MSQKSGRWDHVRGVQRGILSVDKVAKLPLATQSAPYVRPARGLQTVGRQYQVFALKVVRHAAPHPPVRSVCQQKEGRKGEGKWASLPCLWVGEHICEIEGCGSEYHHHNRVFGCCGHLLYERFLSIVEHDGHGVMALGSP
jgi:hypothetical protein